MFKMTLLLYQTKELLRWIGNNHVIQTTVFTRVILFMALMIPIMGHMERHRMIRQIIKGHIVIRTDNGDMLIRIEDSLIDNNLIHLIEKKLSWTIFNHNILRNIHRNINRNLRNHSISINKQHYNNMDLKQHLLNQHQHLEQIHVTQLQTAIIIIILNIQI